MIKSVRDFERSNKELLARNRKYLRDRDYLAWSEPTLDLIRAEYNVQKAVVTSLYSRLEYFIKLHELNLYDPTVQTVARRISRIIQIHVDRVDKYLKASNKESLEGTEEEKSAKLLFDNELYKDINKIKNDIESLRIDEGKKAEGITFFDNAVCPLMMHPIIIREYPEVDALLKDMKIDFDSPPKNKMLIQYDKDEIPYWDARLHYWEQTPEALQFYVDEFKKIKNGIKLGDYYIEPWLYVHLNVCVYNIPTSYKNKLTGLMENRDTPQNPPLRDNEWWIIQDNYQKAKEEKKYLFLCASRRVAKTTSKASMAVTTVLQGKAQTVIAGGSDSDLGQLTNAIKFSLNNQHPAFQIPRQGSEDWNDQVDIAVKRMNRKNISEQAIYIRNTRAGGKRSDQILAGFAMDALLYDEIMKAPFIKQLEAADPALHSNDVLRAIPILSGCVCAGTKVWTNNGDIVNIEDLKQEDGILGFNKVTGEVTDEPITWMQPPGKKQCYRITTNKKREIECSIDHPILKRYRRTFDESRGDKKRKIEFVEAKNLKVGDHILIANKIPLRGDKDMWEPRMVGLLIGDGSYGYDATPVMSTCDEEINDYVYSKFDAVLEKEYLTKDGRDYKETRVRGITKQLRELGIYGQTRMKKRLPDNLYSYKKEDLYELLGGLIDSDGHVVADGKNYSIHFTTANRGLLDEVVTLMETLGIHPSYFYHKPNKNNPRSGKNGHYILTISDRDSVLELYRNVKLVVKKKSDRLEKCYHNYLGKGTKTNNCVPGTRIETIVKIEEIGVREIYNLTAGNTNTYIANGIITHNTGGNELLSRDAISVLNNLSINKIYEMDWDLFESRIPDIEYNRTWRRDPFATFIPAQMSSKEGLRKIEMNLSDYLKTDSKDFDGLKIQVTDWTHNNDVMDKQEEYLKVDRSKLVSSRVSFPRCPKYIFLSGQESPFPNEEVSVFLMDKDLDRGTNVDISQDGSKNIILSPTNKTVATFPFGGGSHNGPITIFEEPVSNPPRDFYVAGLDDYSQETANSDSIGSLVIYRRDTRKVVATLHTRPKPHSKFHQDIMLLLDYYNAKVFMENADMEFKTYLDAISPNHADRYLYRSVNFLTDMELSQWDRVEIRDFGWAPTTKNKKTLFGLAVKEASNTYKSFEEDGDHRVYMGYENFKDPRILQEIVSWKPHGNFDGLTALMGALGIDFYLTFSGITFTDDIQVTKEKSKPSRPVDRHRSSFGSSNRSSLSTTRNRQIKSNF